jgi:YegS/Rv2252/BmrU family lipid kinase
VSGKGSALAIRPQVEDWFNKHDIPYRIAVSTHFRSAIQLASDAYDEGYRQFLVMGGDGSLNEVVQGIAQSDPQRLQHCLLALLPIGKGNDWRRSMRIPHRPMQALQLLLTGRHKPVDIGWVQTQAGRRHFINLAGLGFDAHVAATVNERIQAGKKMNKTGYLITMLRQLTGYRAQTATLVADGVSTTLPLFTGAIGKGQYNGGGMRQTPQAIPDDGTLAVTLVQHMPLWQILLNIPRLFFGTHLSHPKVISFHCERLEIPTPGLLLEADGESLGETPATFGVLPRYLQVLVPNNS